jgi:hypothetical protein
MNKQKEISIYNLTIEEVKILFTSLDFYLGTYHDISHYKDRVITLETLLLRLQTLIEAHEDNTEEDHQVPMEFCQYGEP